jgi:hypothetical protein
MTVAALNVRSLNNSSGNIGARDLDSTKMNRAATAKDNPNPEIISGWTPSQTAASFNHRSSDVRQGKNRKKLTGKVDASVPRLAGFVGVTPNKPDAQDLKGYVDKENAPPTDAVNQKRLRSQGQQRLPPMPQRPIWLWRYYDPHPW